MIFEEKKKSMNFFRQVLTSMLSRRKREKNTTDPVNVIFMTMIDLSVQRILIH